MDPLSIAVSIVGITTAAVQVSRLLKTFIDGANEASTSARGVLMEVTGIYACLHQVQGFLLSNNEATRSRRSLIMIEQVIVIFTDCVSIFSELEQMLETVKTGEHMRMIDRLKWPSKETAISKILARLQASKASLKFMLTISTCTSMDWAEASMRNLTSLVQEVLRTNVDMASRLKNLERMHPALANSMKPSQDDTAISEQSESRANSRATCYRFAFEEELETSIVYKRAGLKQMRFSNSSTASNGPSWFSGLSLSDVTNVSALTLPISPMELWNHHRYGSSVASSTTRTTNFEAWYYPPAKKSAFIRTAYFNGQYTNQYAQSKFTGHLVYRRFIMTAPYSPPIFTEGAIMPQSPRVLDKVGEKFPQMDERYELEGTGTQSAPIRESGQHAVERTSSTGDLTLRTSTSVAVAVTTGAAIELESNPPPNFQHPQHRTIALHCTSSKVLPPLPPKALEGDETITLNRREVRSPSCSILCEEEEGIFPARKWTKPLANMGDALNWKFSVLHRFNAIQY